MTIFVDASAIVAMLGLEPDYEALAIELDRHDDRATSAVAWWEAVVALSRQQQMSVEEARFNVDAFLKARQIRFVAIGAAEAAAALDAYRIYGKGRHPAALNMGDCFAYACARANSARMLYKGDDFARTDLA